MSRQDPPAHAGRERFPRDCRAQTLAVEYSQEGVRVNAIAPGSVSSGITNNVEFPPDLSKAESRLVRRIMSPTGFGEPEDVASVVALLLSDDGKHMTGECIRIDGGTHARHASDGASLQSALSVVVWFTFHALLLTSGDEQSSLSHSCPACFPSTLSVCACQSFSA